MYIRTHTHTHAYIPIYTNATMFFPSFLFIFSSARSPRRTAGRAADRKSRSALPFARRAAAAPNRDGFIKRAARLSTVAAGQERLRAPQVYIHIYVYAYP